MLTERQELILRKVVVAYQAAEYPRWVATLDALTGDLSPQAKRKLWAENARRFYRLP